MKRIVTTYQCDICGVEEPDLPSGWHHLGNHHECLECSAEMTALNERTERDAEAARIALGERRRRERGSQ
jgi:hypothetical protein